MAGSHRIRRPRFGEPGWSAARGRGGGCDVVAVRRAAAAAVGATLSAAVATIVTDGPPATVQAVRSPEVSPSAMDPFMPVSVERPTGVHPASAHSPAARPTPARAAGTRRIVPVAGAAQTPAPRDAAHADLNAARAGMSIGRLVEPTALSQDTVRRSTAVNRRPTNASIGDLHLTHTAGQQPRPGRSAWTR